MYSVVTVTGQAEWRQFLAMPRRVYHRRHAAIPLPAFEVRRLLDRANSPALQGRALWLLLVRRDDQPVGRCSLLLPREHDGTPALFGFFECVNDQRAADALLTHVEEICAAHGVTAVHGPFSPDTAGLTGVQLDHFDDANVLGEPCALPFYRRLLEGAGYALEKRGRTWRSLTLREDAAALAAALPDRASRYRLRTFGLEDLHEGIRDLATVFDDAFRESWSRERMEQEEYFYAARYLLPAWIEDSLALVYDGSRAIGAVVCATDINPAFRGQHCLPRSIALLRARRLAQRSRTLVGFAIGLHPDYQNSSAALSAVRHFTHVARRYEHMYTTWITEGNHGSERICARFGLQPWRTLGVFRKNL